MQIQTFISFKLLHTVLKNIITNKECTISKLEFIFLHHYLSKLQGVNTRYPTGVPDCSLIVFSEQLASFTKTLPLQLLLMYPPDWKSNGVFSIAIRNILNLTPFSFPFTTQHVFTTFISPPRKHVFSLRISFTLCSIKF